MRRTSVKIFYIMLFPLRRMTFAEKFCTKNNVHPEDFEVKVLRLTLRPTARLLRPLLNLNPDFFAADREFVRGVGRISRIEDFRSEAEDFTGHPEGRSFCHRTLKLRISREVMRRLVRDTLKD